MVLAGHYMDHLFLGTGGSFVCGRQHPIQEDEAAFCRCYLAYWPVVVLSNY